MKDRGKSLTAQSIRGAETGPSWGPELSRRRCAGEGVLGNDAAATALRLGPVSGWWLVNARFSQPGFPSPTVMVGVGG
ncbi:unnamed protein product [Lampetra planeri]